MTDVPEVVLVGTGSSGWRVSAMRRRSGAEFYRLSEKVVGVQAWEQQVERNVPRNRGGRLSWQVAAS